MPALYDLAFSFRDFEHEVDFLLETHASHSGFPACRILDVGAGPARHGIAALQKLSASSSSVTCIDASPDMAGYAQQLAIDELDQDQRENFHYVVDDFRTFQLDNVELFDSAWILLGSLQHLTKNSEVVQCFSCIHKSLRSKGTVVIELPHPRETFTMIDCTRNDWTVPLEDENGADSGELKIIWGDDDDEFDPITQVRQLTIEMKLSSDKDHDETLDKTTSEMRNVRGIVPTRLFTAQEMNALATMAGFDVIAMYGALEEGVPVDDEDAAFRLICVLQKP